MQAFVPHEERFAMSENYDRSTYLTKVRRIQGREFQSYAVRDTEKSVKLGGNETAIDLLIPGAKSQEYYES